MSLMTIETHNEFSLLLFHMISVHSMQRTEVHIFQREIIHFEYLIDVVSHCH